MAALLSSLRRILADLQGQESAWALIGGLAVSARTEPRTTRDVDLVVAVNDDSGAEQVLRVLLGRGYTLDAVLEQTEARRMATARLTPPVPGDVVAVVDLLFASSGIETDIVERAERLAIFPELWAPVASVGDLLALKLLSRDDETRPQDAGDLRMLCKIATVPDVDTARAAVAAIEARGFSRGRDLKVLLDEALGRWSNAAWDHEGR